MNKLERRDFLKLAGGITLSSFVIPDELLAENGDNFNDFKALVVVDLQGGNDAINSFIPADSRSGINTGYEKYTQARSGVTRILDNDLMGDLKRNISNGNLEFGSASSNPYYENGDIYKSYIKGFYLLDRNGFDSKVAINPIMPEIAYWMDKGVGAIIQNVGNLPYPATKQELRDKKVKLPPFLFAHNQQSILMRTGQASSITFPTGWLGRLADRWQGLNGSDVYKMNISLSTYGKYKMFFGNSTEPMSYSNYGPVDFKTLSLEAQKELAQLGNMDKFHTLYKETVQNIIKQTEVTINDWNSVSKDREIFSSLKDSYGISFYDSRGIVKVPESDLYGLSAGGVQNHHIASFVTAAKLIKIGKDKGFKRMVIAITLGGYDQHSTQPKTHSQRLRNLSLGTDRFMRAMEHLGLLNDVTLFTVSEFARSLGSNRDGTDHAWGGSYMVLGGAVKPGNYGRFPDLTLEGEDDYTVKGRFIPSTSFTQYYATLLKWFGADSDVMAHALPELKNFDLKDLGFMG